MAAFDYIALDPKWQKKAKAYPPPTAPNKYATICGEQGLIPLSINEVGQRKKHKQQTNTRHC